MVKFEDLGYIFYRILYKLEINKFNGIFFRKI